MALDQGRIEGCKLDADSSFVGILHLSDFIEGVFILPLRGACQRMLNHLHFSVFIRHVLGQLDLLSGQKFHHLECGIKLQPCCKFVRHIRDLGVCHDLVVGDQGSLPAYRVTCECDLFRGLCL